MRGKAINLVAWRHPDAKASAPRQHGYVLLTLILLGALVTAATMTFARHAMLAVDDTAMSLEHQLGENAMGSGMAFVTQALRADTSTTLSQSLGNEQLSVQISAITDTQRRIVLTSSENGSPNRNVTALAELYPAGDGTLPSLSDAAKSEVGRAAGVTVITADTRLADTEIFGIIVIGQGVRLTVDDVVVRGSILTENAMLGGSWSAGQEAQLVLQGGLTIIPGATLSGLAMAAPDVILDGSHADAALQVVGALVVRGIAMGGPALFRGPVATELTPVFAGQVEFPGAGRVPLSWPDTLVVHTREVGRLTFPVFDPTSGETTAIQNFAWPVKVSQTDIQATQPTVLSQ